MKVPGKKSNSTLRKGTLCRPGTLYYLLVRYEVLFLAKRREECKSKSGLVTVHVVSLGISSL